LYKGKAVTIIGVVQSIHSEFLGGPTINLVDNDNGSLHINTIDCEFNKENKEILLFIKVGEHVKVKGIVKDQILGSIAMDNCTLEIISK